MSEPTGTTDNAGVSGTRRGADTAFAYLAALFSLGVLAQVMLAGRGVFGLGGDSVEDASSLDLHRDFGHILGIVALVMLILALVARTSQQAIWGSLVLVVLTEVVQTLLAEGGDDHAWVGGLHALDGVLILLIGLGLHLASRRRISSA